MPRQYLKTCPYIYAIFYLKKKREYISFFLVLVIMDILRADEMNMVHKFSSWRFDNINIVIHTHAKRREKKERFQIHRFIYNNKVIIVYEHNL